MAGCDEAIPCHAARGIIEKGAPRSSLTRAKEECLGRRPPQQSQPQPVFVGRLDAWDERENFIDRRDDVAGHRDMGGDGRNLIAQGLEALINVVDLFLE